MSFSAPDPLSVAGLSSGLPAPQAAEIPAAVQRQGSKATQAYAEGLAFEQVLTNQLATQLTGTIAGGQDSGYASLIPQALTQGLQSAGGLGIAAEIAQELDPGLTGIGGAKQ